MSDFFSHDLGIMFKPFGLLHIFILFSTISIAFLIYIYQLKLSKLKINKHIPFIFASILLLNQIIFYFGYGITGNFDVKTDLPLHYCYITGYLYIFMLYFNKKKMYKWLYYAVFMCTITVLIWMNTTNSYDRYVFYFFTISHSGLFLMNLYLFYVMNYKTTKAGFVWAYIYSNILFIIMYFYNIKNSTNYIMSRELPPFILDLYPWITVVKYPIFWLEIAGLLMCLIAYLVTKTKKAE